tara:strand:- start:1828 stop:2094 length:267 start_codon:yes stop_codon:yes gene_type:complete
MRRGSRSAVHAAPDLDVRGISGAVAKKASEGEMNDLKELADYTEEDDENEPDYDPIAEQRAEDEMIERQIEDEPERLAELRQIQENAT